MAHKFSEQGCKLVLWDIDQKGLDKVCEYIFVAYLLNFPFIIFFFLTLGARANPQANFGKLCEHRHANHLFRIFLFLYNL